MMIKCKYFDKRSGKLEDAETLGERAINPAQVSIAEPSVAFPNYTSVQIVGLGWRVVCMDFDKWIKATIGK